MAHANHNGLIKGGLADVPGRYQSSELGSSAWLFLYETEKRGWKAAVKGKKIGQKGDPSNFFKLMSSNDVHFYDVSAFGVSAFSWGLGEDDFDANPDEVEDLPDFDDRDDDDDGDDFFFY